MKSNFYLQHPLMAMHDPRMKNLVEKESLKGCGAYWFILEKLALLPEPYAELAYLKPFCKGIIPFTYLKKIILEYQLFKLEEGDVFSPLELNPSRIKEEKEAENKQKTALNRQKTAKNKQNLSENERKSSGKQLKMARKTQKKQQKKTDNTQFSNYLSQSNIEKSRAYNTIYNITTTSSSEEKRRKSDDDDKGYGKQQTPHPVRPWMESVNRMSQDSSYLELAYIHCGYGELLRRHFKEAIEYFKQHIVLYHKQENLTNEHEVYKYFSNFTSPGNRTCQELRNYLTQLDRHHHSCDSNPYRYEQRIDGKRTYNGCPIPQDAPPRPDQQSIWNSQKYCWMPLRPNNGTPN